MKLENDAMKVVEVDKRVLDIDKSAAVAATEAEATVAAAGAGAAEAAGAGEDEARTRARAAEKARMERDRVTLCELLSTALADALAHLLAADPIRVDPFLQPVLPEDAPDYESIVTRPMDLGTIEDSLHEGIYRRPIAGSTQRPTGAKDVALAVAEAEDEGVDSPWSGLEVDVPAFVADVR